MSIKRTVARVQVKARRYKREKERKELRKLALERNKALKEALSASKLAKAKEEARGAQLKRMRAKGIEPKKSAVKSRTKAGKKAGSGIIKALRATRKFVKKHSR